MRPPLSHPNEVASGFLEGYFSASEACREHPWLDCILSGVLALRTEGDSGTRALSRKVLFTVLQTCPDISTRQVHSLLGERYQGRSIERYAASARVAAKAIESRISSGVDRVTNGLREARRQLDAPYVDGLSAAEAVTMAPRRETLAEQWSHCAGVTWAQVLRRAELECIVE